MFRKISLAAALGTGLGLALAAAPAAAQCIENQGAFGQYKQSLASKARGAGVGQRGLQALDAVQLSGTTWKFAASSSGQGVSSRSPEQLIKGKLQVSVDRFVGMGRGKLSNNQRTFDAIEARYGVPREILVTLWGLETAFGGYMGNHGVLSGAVTLAAHCRRSSKFEPNAIAALQMVDRGTLTTSMKGGPTGELGHLQFIPIRWMQYGVDGNGDGRADPYNAVDALASAANMLRQNGWRAGQPFGEGTANYNALAIWNDSGNYRRAIAYAAERM